MAERNTSEPPTLWSTGALMAAGECVIAACELEAGSRTSGMITLAAAAVTAGICVAYRESPGDEPVQPETTDGYPYEYVHIDGIGLVPQLPYDAAGPRA